MFATGPGRAASQSLVQLGGLGCTLALGVVVCSWLGLQVDRWLGSAPIGLVVGCLLGSAGGFIKLVRDAQAAAAAADRADHARSQD
ncbi:MAG: AtpZ/AtpI family protein [Fimbriimonadaceae bacterium]|nr:AtpZ/AtpI family protein [Fimbriimonadaceae bacterium]